MKIIREDLVTGKRKTVSTYDNITTTTASNFMLGCAKTEAETLVDASVDATADVLSGRATATVKVKGSEVARYSMEW